MTLLPRLWTWLRTLRRWCPQCGQCLAPLEDVDRWEAEQGRGQWCVACGWEAHTEEEDAR
jgi:hypothetical protein